MEDNRAPWARLSNSLKLASASDQAEVSPTAADSSESTTRFTGDQWQYRQILEQQAELICIYLADTTLLYVNPAYCRYFGLAREAVLHQSYLPVIYEGDREAVSRQVASMTCTNPQVMIENRVVARGEVRWTQWNNRCLCDEQGQIVAYQSVGRDISHLKQIEAELRASEHRYRSLIETIPQLVWVAQSDGLHTLDFNQRWFDFTGQTPETAKGEGWLSAVHPDDIDRITQKWAEATANKTAYETEYRLRRADGTYVWHLAKAEPVRSQAGRVTRWYGTCTDISDRKQQEAKRQATEQALQKLNETLEERIYQRTVALMEANQSLRQEIAERHQAEGLLKESEERFRRAIIDAPFPIILHAEDGKILQMSQAVSDITGYAANELTTIEDWTEQVYGNRQAPVLEDINRLYSLNHRLDEGEYAVVTKQGETRIWLFSSAPLGRLSDGRRSVISMAADVTQQKQTEVALAGRLRQQAVVTQLSQTALTNSDLQTLFDQSVQLVAESLGVDCCRILQLLPDAQSLLLVAGVGWRSGTVGQATVAADDCSQVGYLLRARHPLLVEDLCAETRFQGSHLLTEHQVTSGISTLILGHSDRPFGVLGAYSTRRRSFTQDDINFLQSVANLLAAAINRKSTEQELQHLNLTLEKRIHDRTRALEEVNHDLQAFSYSVAHDLRAPLRAIRGFAQVLEEDYSPALDQVGKEYIHRMAQSAEHLDVLIQDLLAYSQLGRATVILQRVNVAHLIDSILQELQPNLAAQWAQVEVEPDLPIVLGQKSILRQVLSNLINNALKFVAPQTVPKIRIGAEQRPAIAHNGQARSTWVRIWIQDNGIGILPQHQQRIFHPFERLHSVDACAGTGIGLSIVQRGMQRMGGRVGVESAENQGSCFWIELQGCAQPD